MSEVFDVWPEFNNMNTILIINSATSLWLSQARTYIYNVTCRGLIFVVRGNWSFCRYWWNWWQSLFRRSFIPKQDWHYLDVWCLTPLSTIVQFYCCGCWWRTPECTSITTDLLVNLNEVVLYRVHLNKCWDQLASLISVEGLIAYI